jgi:hypothetical protein
MDTPANLPPIDSQPRRLLAKLRLRPIETRQKSLVQADVPVDSASHFLASNFRPIAFQMKRQLLKWKDHLVRCARMSASGAEICHRAFGGRGNYICSGNIYDEVRSWNGNRMREAVVSPHFNFYKHREGHQWQLQRQPAPNARRTPLS